MQLQRTIGGLRPVLVINRVPLVCASPNLDANTTHTNIHERVGTHTPSRAEQQSKRAARERLTPTRSWNPGKRETQNTQHGKERNRAERATEQHACSKEGTHSPYRTDALRQKALLRPNPPPPPSITRVRAPFRKRATTTPFHDSHTTPCCRPLPY